MNCKGCGMSQSCPYCAIPMFSCSNKQKTTQTQDILCPGKNSNRYIPVSAEQIRMRIIGNYREAQQRYRKEVRKASKDTWRTFCSSINDLPRSARYTGLFLGTLRLNWVILWLLQVDVSNLRVNLRALANHTLSQFRGYTGVGGLCGYPPCWTF
jgi:hypothetical protein